MGEHEKEREVDSYGDLIPLDISWLVECGGTPLLYGAGLDYVAGWSPTQRNS